MLVITLAEKGGATQVLEFSKPEVSIGRLAGNDIVLGKGNISKYHSRIVERDGKLHVVDLQSTNGTYVNGKRVSAPLVVRPTDRVYIGDYVLSVEPARATAAPVASPVLVRPVDDGVDAESITPLPLEGGEGGAEGHPTPVLLPGPGRAGTPALPAGEAGLRKAVHERLIAHLDLRRMDVERLGEGELRRRTEKAIRDILARMGADGELPAGTAREQLVGEVLDEALGLGPLEGLLADESVSEIMVNHARQIFVERQGRLTLSDRTFSSDQAVLGVIERIVAPLGRRIDESSPLVDARLRDGSRVNAIIPPLALKGPCLTIRKFRRVALGVDDLVRSQTLSAPMAAFLEVCVRARRNLVISGGTGSGKTTTLNVLTAFIPPGERIITVEDAAELQLQQAHWVQLETRPPNLEGRGAVSVRDLVKNCLRMRPDRIVVGECRSGEALDMLQAMNTGHDGSLTTLHANSPRDALSRLETMVLMAGMDLPVRAIREQMASAVHLLVQQTRFADGSRKVTSITEVTGMEGEVITLQDVFRFEPEGFGEDGAVRGRFVASGFVPRFCEELRRQGAHVNLDLFRAG